MSFDLGHTLMYASIPLALVLVAYFVVLWWRGVKDRRDATMVYLRGETTPVRYWTERVLYDAWGTPYVYGTADTNLGISILRSDGLTKVGPYGPRTRWKLKSGPPVDFDRPKAKDMFDD